METTMTPHAPLKPPDYWQRIAQLAFDMMTLDGKLPGREAYLLAKQKVDEGLEQMQLPQADPNGWPGASDRTETDSHRITGE